MRSIIVICGVRPQFIKAAAFIFEMRRTSWFKGPITVFNTSQHYDDEMSVSVANDIGLQFDVVLGRSDNTNPGAIIARAISEIEMHVLSHYDRRPVMVVFGDANVALAGAIAALKTSCQLVHVEAGARRSPDEQEHHNSRLVDAISDLRLCVTERAMTAIANEQLTGQDVLTGDFSYRWMMHLIENQKTINTTATRGYVLCSLHRPNNMSRVRMRAFLEAVRVSQQPSIFLLHHANRQLLGAEVPPTNLTLLDPVPYTELLGLVTNCQFVITDSGGLAREAHLFAKPVIMRRDMGGWPELIEVGVLRRVEWTVESLLAGMKWGRDLSRRFPARSSPLVRPGGIDEGLRAIRTLCMQ